jgi:hypothetical protein
MPANDRGGLKAAFTGFTTEAQETEAELKLLGRTIGEPKTTKMLPGSYPVATTETEHKSVGNLTPRPLLHREPVRQISFRCPASVALELKRKAAFNQLEQQEILLEGLKRVLNELDVPPDNWEG